VSQAIEEWERETSTTIDELEIDTFFMDRLAERIRKLDPTKATKEAIKHPQLFRAWEPTKAHAKPYGGFWLLAFVGAIVFLELLSRCST
jgi:hypothetical protein